MKAAKEERLRRAALKVQCTTCCAMPGQACRRTWDGGVHLPRSTAAARALVDRVLGSTVAVTK